MTRFICSQDRAEVELVKKELFRAGIRSEIRNNPLAQALRVTRLEVWLEDERDLFNASKLYSALQAKGGKVRPKTPPGKDPSADYVEVEEPNGSSGQDVLAADTESANEVDQASALLEKEIEQMLEQQRELKDTCASLRRQAEELKAAVAASQADLSNETQKRTAAEQKQAVELSSLQQALERERVERARAEEQLGREQRQFQEHLKSREEALKSTQKKLDTAQQQLQTQQTAVVELRKEIVSREREWEEHEKSASKARAEALMEREARVAAEERAVQATAALRTAEERLVEQKDSQRHAYAESLNALRSKMQARMKS